MSRYITDTLGSRWKIVESSVIGADHVDRGLPNQDQCSVRQLGPNWTFFAVADGAGSCSRADQGAHIAVNAAADAAQRLFDQRPQTAASCTDTIREFAELLLSTFDRAVDSWCRSITESAEGAGSIDDVRRSFGTTILAVVACPPYFGYVSVGDCFLVVDRNPGKPYLVVSATERENNSVTTFLTSRTRSQDLDCGVIVDDQICGFALCSDGVSEALLGARNADNERIYYYAPQSFRSYFQHFAAPNVDSQELHHKLASLDFAQTSKDDKTIVMAMRQASTPQSWAQRSGTDGCVSSAV